jgi:hypothetical protein
MREPLAVEAILRNDDQAERDSRGERVLDAGTHDVPARDRSLVWRIRALTDQNLLLSPPNLRLDLRKHDCPVGPGSSAA